MRVRGRPAYPDRLTPAEWSVLFGVRHGMTNARIAARQGVSVAAVKYHLRSLRAKLELTSRQELRAWAGYPRAGAGPHPSGGESMNDIHLGPIAQVSVTVRDIDRAVAFYRDTLGLPHLFTFGQLAFFDCGGTRLFLDALPEARHQGTSVIYFRADGIESTVAGLRARGVSFEGEPHRIHTHADGTEEWMAFFRDPDGNLMALAEQRRA